MLLRIFDKTPFHDVHGKYISIDKMQRGGKIMMFSVAHHSMQFLYFSDVDIDMDIQ